MDVTFEMLEALGPTIVAVLTVPTMKGVKYVVHYVDTMPAWSQQIITVLLAFWMTKLGVWLNVAMPGDVMLFGEQEVSAVLSAGMAMAMHAGQKAKRV